MTTRKGDLKCCNHARTGSAGLLGASERRRLGLVRLTVIVVPFVLFLGIAIADSGYEPVEVPAVVVVFVAPSDAESMVDTLAVLCDARSVHRITGRAYQFNIENYLAPDSVASHLETLLLQGVESVRPVTAYRPTEEPIEPANSQSTAWIDPPAEVCPSADDSPGDPLVVKQWYLSGNCMNTFGAWSTTRGNSGSYNVVIVILDSGIDLDHPEFFSAIGARIDTVSFTNGFVERSTVQNRVDDLFGHGTKMAGVIAAAQGNGGIVGIAPEVQVLIGDVMFADEVQVNQTAPVIWVRAFAAIADSAAANPGRRYVVNVSANPYMSPFDSDDDMWPLLVEEVERCAHTENVLIVAAAGNETSCSYEAHHLWPPAKTWYPAMFSGVAYDWYNPLIDDITVAVGGITYGVQLYQDELYVRNPTLPGAWLPNYVDDLLLLKAYDPTSWAAWGDTCEHVMDVGAPSGGAIRASDPCGDSSAFGIYTSVVADGGSPYGYAIGTSFSSALVAGAAALAWDVNPEMSAQDIKTLMRAMARETTKAYDLSNPSISAAMPIGGSLLREGTGNPHYDLEDTNRPSPLVVSSLYGTTVDWGHNRHKTINLSRLCSGDGIPTPMEVVWPDGELDKTAGNRVYDQICSYAWGNGIVDAGLLVSAAGARDVYRVYGGYIDSLITIQDADVVRIMGDVTVGTGGELRIVSADPNTVTRVQFDDADIFSSGYSPSDVELIVESGGRLVLGSGTTLFHLKPYSRMASSLSAEYPPGWGGIELWPGSIFEVSDPAAKVEFREARRGLAVYSQLLGTLDLTFDDCDTAILVEGSCSLRALHINRVYQGIQVRNGGTLDLDAGGSLAARTATPGTPDRGGGHGISIGTGSLTSGGRIDVTGFRSGLTIAAGGEIAPNGGDISIVANCDTGVVVSGRIGASAMHVSGEFGIGVLLDSGATLGADSLVIEGAGSGTGVVMNGAIEWPETGVLYVADVDTALLVCASGSTAVLPHIRIERAQYGAIVNENLYSAAVDAYGIGIVGVQINGVDFVMPGQLLVVGDEAGGGTGIVGVGDARIDTGVGAVVTGLDTGLAASGNGVLRLAGGLQVASCTTGIEARWTLINSYGGALELSGAGVGTGILVDEGTIAAWAGLDVGGYEIGVDATNSALIAGAEPVSLTGPGHGLGLRLVNSSFTVGDTASISGYDTGMQVLGAAAQTYSGRVGITDCVINGVHVRGNTNIEIADYAVRKCGQNAFLFTDGTSGSLTGVHAETSAGVCIVLRDSSTLDVRGSQFYGTGIAPNPGTTCDAGTIFELGGNAFRRALKGQTLFYIGNLDPEAPVQAVGNLWQDGATMVCPAPAGSVLGPVVSDCD